MALSQGNALPQLKQTPGLLSGMEIELPSLVRTCPCMLSCCLLRPFLAAVSGGFLYMQDQQVLKKAKTLAHLHAYIERCGECAALSSCTPAHLVCIWLDSVGLSFASLDGFPRACIPYSECLVCAGGRLCDSWDCAVRFRTTTRRNGRLGLTTDNVSMAGALLGRYHLAVMCLRTMMGAAVLFFFNWRVAVTLPDLCSAAVLLQPLRQDIPYP